MHLQSAGIEIRFFEKSRLLGEICKRILGYKIRRGVARGFRVMAQTPNRFSGCEV
jgi:hypothetical protein